MSQSKYQLTINGVPQEVLSDDDMPLLWALRDLVGLTGTKYGCGAGLCGACTVHLDGVPTRSCQIAMSDVGSARITTIEGIDGAVAEAVRNAWVAGDVVQCGYCQSGQIMAAAALLAETGRPSDADIDAALDGNICRCGSYNNIRAAIRAAADALGAG